MSGQSHDLSDDAVADRLESVARRALAEYGVGPDAQLTLLNVSENATFAVDDPATGQRTVLRVHRHGYHDEGAILSELAWVDALRDDTGIRTPQVLRAVDGRRVLALKEAGHRDPRHVVHFEFLPGAEPEPSSEGLTPSFELLGAITARMHEHALHWRRPSSFTRFSWDHDAAFGRDPRWGRWQDGMAVGPDESEVLGRLDATLERRLARFGAGADRFGLVHADLRLANLLQDGERTYVIDFDDCGWGWFLYDFGAAVSFFEHDPRIPELADAWVQGYRSVRTLPAEDEAELATFVMMRRLLLVAWIGSHTGTQLAQEMGADFTAGSCELAEGYLARFG